MTGSSIDPHPFVSDPSQELIWNGDQGFDEGGGGSSPSGQPGSSAETPKPTDGESPDCPSESHAREQRAMQQIQGTLGVIGCAMNLHQVVYFEINFLNNTTGVYLGTGAEYRETHFVSEVELPAC